MNKVICAGSRTITDYDLIKSVIIESGFKIDECVSGCANGVDKISAQICRELNISVKEFPANWNDLTEIPCKIKINKFGREYNVLGGHNRNKRMSEYANHLILIWDGKSSGSANMFRLAREKGLQIFEKVVS